MDVRLVVVRPFGTYRKGDLIADSGEIAQLTKGEHAGDVVRVALPATKPHLEA